MELEKTPQLRFTEFTQEWRLTKLSKHSTSVMYGMNSSAIIYDGKHGYIRITDIDDNNCFSPSPLTSPDGQIEEKFRLKSGDIVFARTGANTGKSYLYRESDGEIYFAGFLIKISVIDAVPEFVFQNTFRSRYDNWVHVMSMRSGQPGINAEEYKSYPFYIPEMAEQKKIADFFASVDKKISLLKEKHALLTQYKKGVMQKLFKQGIRFKDESGNAFPDWITERVDYFVERYSEPVEVEPNKSYRQIGIRSHGKGIFHKENVQGYELGGKRVFWVHPNAFVVNIVFAWEHAVAKTSKDEQGFIASHRFPMYLPKDDRVDLRFFTLFFLSKRGKYLLELASPGGAGRNKTLGQSNFAELKVTFPCLEEQKRIADFNDALEEKLEAAKKQIELTQTFKKGLLQQMFV